MTARWSFGHTVVVWGDKPGGAADSWLGEDMPQD